MELFKLQFKTAGKTLEDVKAIYEDYHPSTEVLEQMVAAYRALDGTEVIGAVWEYSPNGYSLYGWNDEDDEKFKEFIYLIEQDELFGSYLDCREEFDADWKNGEYESQAALHFDKSDFEVIEKLEKKESESSE